MVKEKIKTSTSSDCKVVHVKVLGGNSADIYEIGKAMKRFSENLPFKLEAIVTNENVDLRDVNTLIMELIELKKQMDEGKVKL